MMLQKNTLVLAAFMLLFAACDPEEIVPEELPKDDPAPAYTISEAEVKKLISEAESNAYYDQLDMMMTRLMSMSGNGRMLAASGYVPSCASVTYNSGTRTTTVDFGEGCTDVDNRVHKGKIVINSNGSLYETGSFAIVSFEEYSVNNVRVEGIRTIENVTTSSSPHLQFSTTLRGGKLTWPDGSFALCEADHQRTWIRADNPENDQWYIEGNASGKNREGQEYTSTIRNTLVFKMACRPEGVFIPVAGIKVIARPGESDATLDFGNGSCDNDVTITADGSSKTVTISWN